MRFEGRTQGEKIVLTNVDGEKRKWVFVKIEDNFFRWQDIAVTDGGRREVKFDIFAERLS